VTTIRPADRVNLPALLRLAHALHDEAPNMRGVPLDDERTIANFSALVDAGLAVIAQGADGAIAGFMLFDVGFHQWTGERMAKEEGLYVAPASRGRMLANRLIAAAEARAMQEGAILFHAGTWTGTATEAACAVYARAGFADVGRQFRKRLVPLESAEVNRNVPGTQAGVPP